MTGQTARRQALGNSVLLTLAALTAFAANSLLCRAALAPGQIDPASFTAIRVASGALLLGLLVGRGKGVMVWAPDWRMALVLFVYMVGFSWAYQSLTAATGALLLFGFVQLTMFAVMLIRSEPFPALAWPGVGLAVVGLVCLLLPGLQAPPLFSAVLMALAGIAWGAYSILGRGAARPLQLTAASFLACVPLSLLLLVWQWSDLHMTPTGLALAMASGALASGLGYVAWYAVLPSLGSGTAASVQLAVPVLTALAGAGLLGEALTSRVVVSAVLTLGGIALVLWAQHRRGAAGRVPNK